MTVLQVSRKDILIREYHLSMLWDEKTSDLRGLRFRASTRINREIFTAFGLTLETALEHLLLRVNGNENAYFRSIDDERNSVN